MISDCCLCLLQHPRGKHSPPETETAPARSLPYQAHSFSQYTREFRRDPFSPAPVPLRKATVLPALPCDDLISAV